jgi:NAD(P)-dependent dehydrogenase (short-subunit alcohol dehydrogenase family)
MTEQLRRLYMSYDNRLFNLQGKSAYVTGAASGINKLIAYDLCRAGASVCIADINWELAQEVSEEFNQLGFNTFPMKVDVSQKDQVAAVVAAAVERFGGLDIAVNGAGVIGTRLPASEEIEEKDARRLFDIMWFGMFFGCQEAVKVMKPGGSGRIINIASMSGVIVNRGIKGIAPYAGIKAGIIHMTKAFASELAEDGITVNSISPGYTRTPANSAVFDIPERNKTYMDQIPMQRFGKPEDISPAAVFLASDEAGYITGQNFIIDGGVTVW